LKAPLDSNQTKTSKYHADIQNVHREALSKQTAHLWYLSGWQNSVIRRDRGLLLISSLNFWLYTLVCFQARLTGNYGAP